MARLADPWRTLVGHPDRSLRVQARPRYRSGDFIEIVTPAEPLKQELRAFLLNSLLVSLLISVTAGALLYLGLALLVLRPLRRVTRSIEHFAADPESQPDAPSDRHDEIGRVERELAQGGEGPEDEDAVLVHVLQQPEHALPLALQVPVVDPLVLHVQRHREGLLDLRRQVLGHLALGAPEQEGPDAAAQPP